VAAVEHGAHEVRLGGLDRQNRVGERGVAGDERSRSGRVDLVLGGAGEAEARDERDDDGQR
jgi:hypothetical protein